MLARIRELPDPVRVIDKRLDPLQDLGYQPFTDIEDALSRYQALVSSRSRNADSEKLITTRGIGLFQSRSLPGLGQ
jgi:hypothetical protein